MPSDLVSSKLCVLHISNNLVNIIALGADYLELGLLVSAGLLWSSISCWRHYSYC